MKQIALLITLLIVGCKDKCVAKNASASICTVSGATTTCVYKCSGSLTETTSAPELEKR